MPEVRSAAGSLRPQASLPTSMPPASPPRPSRPWHLKHSRFWKIAAPGGDRFGRHARHLRRRLDDVIAGIVPSFDDALDQFVDRFIAELSLGVRLRR